MSRLAAKDRKFILHSAHRQVGVARFSQMQRSESSSDARRLIDVFSSPFDEDIAHGLIDRLQTDFAEDSWRFRIRFGGEFEEVDPFDTHLPHQSSDCILLLCGEEPFTPAILDRLRSDFYRGKTLIVLNAGAPKSEAWRDFTKEILGASFDDSTSPLAKISLRIADGRHYDPLIRNVCAWNHLEPAGIPHLDSCALPLLVGVSHGEISPVAWQIENDSVRCFATILGTPQDYCHPSFIQLINNTLIWGAG
jgi:hypothetical protein